MDSNILFFLRVQVWALFLQAATYGVYSITCVYCFRAFFATRSGKRRWSGLNWPMFIIFFLFLMKASSSAAIHIYLNLELATLDSREDAAMEFMDRSDPINISRATTILVQTAISSGVWIYRAWLVYGRSWLAVALPLVLWLGAVAVMVIAIYIDGAVKANGLFAISEARTFSSSFWAIIITVNIITSALIVRRIWRVDHFSFQTDTDESATPTAKKPSVGALTGQSHETMKQATRIIIESGLIYTTMTLITFFLFVANTAVVYAAMDVLVQAIGISFNLMIIRTLPTETSESSLSNLNGVPLQFVPSNISAPGSAIEFALPKHFIPRRKDRSVLAPAPAPGDGVGLAVSEATHNHSQQTI